MTPDLMTEDEAKRRFVEDTDALNCQAQAEGPAAGSAVRMRAIIAEHERKCAELSSRESAPQIAGGDLKRVER